jgi:hypothetical protein
MMKTFKTLAEFKKILQVGDNLHCMNHIRNLDMGVRKVSIAQTNSFALSTRHVGSQEMVDSWCEYPKASLVKIENNVLTVLVRNSTGELIPALSYRFY